MELSQGRCSEELLVPNEPGLRVIWRVVAYTPEVWEAKLRGLQIQSLPELQKVYGQPEQFSGALP